MTPTKPSEQLSPCNEATVAVYMAYMRALDTVLEREIKILKTFLGNHETE